MQSKLLPTWLCPLLLLATLLIITSAHAQSEHKSLTVVSHLTGWTNDTTGYHPAIFLILENSSGRDLSNILIKFQGRFMDLDAEAPTIGREEVRQDLQPHQKFRVRLIGKQPFELPFDVATWPRFEAKVMCRIGDVQDEGTETLIIANVQQKAVDEGEAFKALNETSLFKTAHGSGVDSKGAMRETQNNLLVSGSRGKRTQRAANSTTRPVDAAAGNGFLVSSVKHSRIEQVTPVIAHAQASVSHADHGGVVALLSGKDLPMLGDDFYKFEKRFGLPVAVDAKPQDWTWAKYHDGSHGVDVIAGSKKTGKVDLVCVCTPRTATVSDESLLAAARSFVGAQKTKPQPLERSVRYLPSGRLELLSAVGTNYQIVELKPSAEQSDNGFILVVSRGKQDVKVVLADCARKSLLLKPVSFLASQ